MRGRKKYVVFALAAMVLSGLAALVLLLGADLFLHHRAEKSAGLNRKGFRGPVVGRKQSGELRVAVLGGSTVFGYGVAWNESIPAFLEAKLRDRLNRPVTVVNLGYNNEGAFAFVPTLQDYSYLDYDAIVLYEGYNDLWGDDNPNRSVYRRESAIFRLTGYLPILPLYLEEKAKLLRYGGDLNLAYEQERLKDGKTVFRPNLTQRTSANALEAMQKMTEALEAQLAHLSEKPKAALPSESKFGCERPWISYCDSIGRAVQYGLARGNGVVIGSQPQLSGVTTTNRHSAQQAALARMIQDNFPGNPRVAWADFSSTVDLRNPDLTFDAMHLSPKGNAIIAEGLVGPVLAVTAKK